MESSEPDGSGQHRWRVYRCGGVNQILVRTASDLEAIETLDQKLWMALAMPVAGVAIDPATLALLDSDQDGTIRPPEILAAVRWMREALTDTSLLFEPGDTVPLTAIRRPDLLAAARRILNNLGLAEAGAIGMNEVADQARIFSGTRFNGDGVVPADSAGEDDLREALDDILRVLPSMPDRSGKPGVNADLVRRFFEEAAGWCEWADRPAGEPAIAPLGLEATAAASTAVEAVRAKIDDFFTRVRLAAFDSAAAAALQRTPDEYRVRFDGLLETDSEEIASLPLARVEAGGALPLTGPLNPAWAPALGALAERAVASLLDGPTDSLDEERWGRLHARLAPYAAWQAAEPVTPVKALGRDRLRGMLSGNLRERLEDLIRRDLEPRQEYDRIAAVEKLVRFRRDLVEVLANTVHFSGFYGPGLAAFQAGTLYLDARACSLCVEVVDPVRHAVLAGLSGVFLAYCDLTRPGGLKRTVVAAFTDGDSDNLMVGRNGVFYDRQGLDWNATITRIVSNPISVREAFWLPYKKLVRLIEEQIARRAQAADAASTAKLSDTAAGVTVAAPRAAETPRKIDLGAIALIGTAIGGISALVGGFLEALFGLGYWLPLGVLGVLLLISGPSMLLASMKLRQRNLGPLLDAGGWAVNTRARINLPFGAALTRLAVLPAGARRIAVDPFDDKRRRRAWLGLLVALLLLAVLWRTGGLDALLPEAARRGRCELGAESPAPHPPPLHEEGDTP